MNTKKLFLGWYWQCCIAQLNYFLHISYRPSVYHLLPFCRAFLKKMIAGHTKVGLQNWPSLYTLHKSEKSSYSFNHDWLSKLLCHRKIFWQSICLSSNIRHIYVQNPHDNSYRYLALLHIDTHAFCIINLLMQWLPFTKNVK